MILSRRKLEERLREDFPSRLVITPLLRPEQLDDTSGVVDLSLGQEFIVAERAALEVIDPRKKPEEVRERLGDYLRHVHVPFGDFFALHPRQFALAATLEYIALPGDLAAYVIGRSRWARVGLVIAMATFVHPCFSGTLTLELQNLGDVPVKLYPSTCVAQLVLHEAAGDPEAHQPGRSGQFFCATGPKFPILLSEGERRLLELLRKSAGIEDKCC